MPARASVALIWDGAAALVEAFAAEMAREYGPGSKAARRARAVATRMRMIGFLDSRREVSIDPTPVGAIGPDDNTPVPPADAALEQSAVAGDPPEAPAAGASDAFWLDPPDDDPTGPFG